MPAPPSRTHSASNSPASTRSSVAGWIRISIGPELEPVRDLTRRYLVAYPLLFAGVVALYGGTIALLFKIIADANAAANPQ